MRQLAVVGLFVFLAMGSVALAGVPPEKVTIGIAAVPHRKFGSVKSAEVAHSKGWWATHAPSAGWVALFGVLINSVWNIANTIRGTRIERRSRSNARKMAAISGYREDSKAPLKAMQKATADLTELQRTADYNEKFRSLEQRFVEAHSELDRILDTMSTDPEIDGIDWRNCIDDLYDDYLGCCNVLLASDTSGDAWNDARDHLKQIESSMRAAVLRRFSDASDAA